jgi:hypothetical protein
MPIIRSLRPNVSRDEAVAHFSSGGISGVISPLLTGRLRSLADFYIPFRIIRLSVFNRGRAEQKILAIDSVTGALMPYVFQAPPPLEQIIEVETRNIVALRLREPDALRIAETRCQRMLFVSGFFRIRDLKITSEFLTQIHIPYWIGFRGSGDVARFSVLDAVRRRTEGAKVRQIVRNWLISEPDPGLDPHPQSGFAATRF